MEQPATDIADETSASHTTSTQNVIKHAMTTSQCDLVEVSVAVDKERATTVCSL